MNSELFMDINTGYRISRVVFLQSQIMFLIGTNLYQRPVVTWYRYHQGSDCVAPSQHWIMNLSANIGHFLNK